MTNSIDAQIPELDEIDLSILRALQADGRMSNVELAQRCNLSPSSTLERVRRLERAGIIEGYTARVNPGALGHQVLVFVMVTMREHDQKALVRFEKAVSGLPEVLECHHVAGEYDFLLKALVRDVAALRNMLVERLSALPGVARIHTTLILATSKHVLDVPLG
jgi:Lrp/AsnC family transcriptional regulator, leucine-responsive regulatory protein